MSGLPAPSTPTDAAEPALPGVRALIEAVMRGGASVAAECPLVFEGPLGAARQGRLVALAEGGRPRSACAILPRDCVVGDRRLRLGLIGYVVTAPEARGRGLARRVLAAAEDALRARGCVASLLWPDDAAFYERLGYRAVGAELDFELDPASLSALPRWAAVRPLDPRADADAVHALAMERPIRVERTVEETRALLATPGVDGRVALRGDRVVAFACAGKGHDLPGVIHEWAGETLAVLGLAAELAATQHRAGRRAFLFAPYADLPVARGLSDLGVAAAPGVLGMGRLLDPDGARRALGPDAARADADGLLDALLPTPERSTADHPYGALFAWGLDSI